MGRKRVEEGTAEKGATEVEQKVSKAKMVRTALAEGFESPEEGVDFIRRTFGTEMTRQHFSSYKSQEKSKGSVTGKKSKPRSQPTPVAATPRVNGRSMVVEDLAAVKDLVKRLGGEQVKQIVGLFE